MGTKENTIQSLTLKTLREYGVFCWRNNNTAIWDARLNGYRAHNGLKGVPDILAVIKGQFVGIEVKTRTGRQNADQKLFQQRLERNGGKYYLVRSKEEVDKIIEDYALSKLR